MSKKINVGWLVVKESRDQPGPRIQGYNLIDYYSKNPHFGIIGKVVGDKNYSTDINLYKNFDLIIFQRCFSPEHQELARNLSFLNKSSVFIMNDWHLATEYDSPEIQNIEIIAMSNVVDKVIVPSNLLLKKIQSMTDTDVEFIPDATDPHMNSVSYNNNLNVKLGVTTKHNLDIFDPLDRLAYPDYSLSVIGHSNVSAVIKNSKPNSVQAKNYSSVIGYKNMNLVLFNDLSTMVETHIWDRNLVTKQLSECDIGIIPVHKEIPSRLYKSDNRAALMMSLGLPVVATPIDSYEELISNGVNGYLCSSKKDWFNALEELRLNPDKRREIGMNGQNLVKSKRDISVVAQKYTSTIYNLVK